jgi:error-prone DNA polymerase
VTGSDSPAWSGKREGYAGAPADLRDRRGRDDGGDRLRAPYAELHVHSNFSFLDLTDLLRGCSLRL